eukprot:TRINITY_DN22936_c0_g1_i1.p1 TRINITY_DN22936_c0_g1~~TRINITY_DN22936_c0_g1_i1.p1  ORF type:complete len:560 (+),score=94.56 TRINITY_DN22936_c0_g1_i1:49-1728(+)
MAVDSEDSVEPFDDENGTETAAEIRAEILKLMNSQTKLLDKLFLQLASESPPRDLMIGTATKLPAFSTGAPSKPDNQATAPSSGKCVYRSATEASSFRAQGKKSKTSTKGAVTAARLKLQEAHAVPPIPPRFDHAMAGILVLNAIYVGVQCHFSYYNVGELVFSILEYIFSFVFLCELGVRLNALGCRDFFRGNDRHWNSFDFLVVFTSSLDTMLSWIVSNADLGNVSLMRIVRLVRIARVMRVIRLLKFFKDLRVLVSAIMHTLRTAAWSMLILFVSTYLFSVSISQFSAPVVIRLRDSEAANSLSDTEADLLWYFGTFHTTLMTLFMSVSGGIDWESAMNPLFQVGYIPSFLLWTYVVFSSFCVLNVITGIYCQCAVESFEKDKDMVIAAQLNEKDRYIDALSSVFDKYDASGDGTLDPEEFRNVLHDEEMVALLNGLDIDARDAATLFEKDAEDGLDVDEFITGCITLRGSAKAVHMERAFMDTKSLKDKVFKIEQMQREILRILDSDFRAVPQAAQRKARKPNEYDFGETLVAVMPSSQPAILTAEEIGSRKTAW